MGLMAAIDLRVTFTLYFISQSKNLNLNIALILSCIYIMVLYFILFAAGSIQYIICKRSGEETCSLLSGLCSQNICW